MITRRSDRASTLLGGGISSVHSARGKRKLIIRIPIIVLAIALVAVAVALLVCHFNGGERQEASIIQQHAEAIVSMDPQNSADVEEVVAEYQAEFDRYYGQIKNSDPLNWTEGDIEKVWFCLVCADKVGLSQHVLQLALLVRYASSNGVDVYGDGFNESDLVEMEDRANANSIEGSVNEIL